MQQQNPDDVAIQLAMLRFINARSNGRKQSLEEYEPPMNSGRLFRMN